MAFVAGLDWGGAHHAVCVIDKVTGAVADRFEVRHDAEGLRLLARRLGRFGDAAGLPVARGCRHPHAIRILGRAWTRVLWRAWQNRTPYDPARHAAAAAMG
jgi:hypothetical protein